MLILDPADPVAVAVVAAIRTGDLTALRRLLSDHPGLAAAAIGADGPRGPARSLLHVVTDWPGHVPNGAQSVRELVGAGADVDARFRGPHAETPLHWAASSDDVEVVDALLDAGAEVDAPGAVIAGGTPLDDATAFGQWNAARRLVERGATVNLFAAASLGLMDALAGFFGEASRTDGEQRDDAFWAACHGGRRDAAAFLLDRGAAVNRVPGWEPLTPLDAAVRSGADDVVSWLTGLGAVTAGELRDDLR